MVRRLGVIETLYTSFIIVDDYLFDPNASSLDRYSRMSPGWQANTIQIFSNVLYRTPLTLPFFNKDKLVRESPIAFESCVSDIFRLASITSRFVIIGMVS